MDISLKKRTDRISTISQTEQISIIGLKVQDISCQKPTDRIKKINRKVQVVGDVDRHHTEYRNVQLLQQREGTCD